MDTVSWQELYEQERAENERLRGYIREYQVLLRKINSFNNTPHSWFTREQINDAQIAIDRMQHELGVKTGLYVK